MKKLLFFNKTFFRCLAHDYFFLLQKYFTKNKATGISNSGCGRNYRSYNWFEWGTINRRKDYFFYHQMSNTMPHKFDWQVQLFLRWILKFMIICLLLFWFMIFLVHEKVIKILLAVLNGNFPSSPHLIIILCYRWKKVSTIVQNFRFPWFLLAE